MKVMVIVKATPSSEAGEMPSEELMKAMGNFNEELVNAGIMQAGEGLKPSSQGVRVRFRDAERLVTEGPFAETTALIAGFWIWQVDSMQQAIEWVKRCPNPMKEDSDIEIRPLYELDDFSKSDPTGEWRSHEAHLREQIETTSTTPEIPIKTPAIQPYLFFGGRCEEALHFYQRAIDARIQMVMRFSESPDPLPAGMLQAGFEDKVMHASFCVGETTIMASDGMNDQSRFDGFRLAISKETAAEVDAVFERLADGGTVEMPLAKTFWSPRFGMVTDRFGVGWMVMAVEPSTQKSSAANDEAEIRRLIKQWSTALEAKDVGAMMQDYAPDALLFDGCPPYKTVGAENIRKVWEHCLPYFPDRFRSEHRDTVIHVDGDIAVMYGIHHFIPEPTDHPCGTTWMRVTVGYRRIDGRWKVIHEHVSVPLNPMNGKAWYITDPDNLEMPDYAAATSADRPISGATR